MDRSHDNLVDALCVWANEVPDRIAFRILTGFGQEVEEISFADLHRDALHIAAHLTPITVPGDRAVLVFSSNAGFIRAFSEPVVTSGLPNTPDRPQLVEELYDRMMKRFAADPERYEFHFISLGALLTRV